MVRKVARMTLSTIRPLVEPSTHCYLLLRFGRLDHNKEGVRNGYLCSKNPRVTSMSMKRVAVGVSISAVGVERRKAQSLVELAFLLPLLLMLSIGIIDMGRAFYTSIAIQGAAEAGSLVAVKYGQSAADVKATIMASTNPDRFPFLSIQDSEITLTMDTSSTGKDTEFTIVVTRNFQLLTPFVANVLGSQALTLRSAVTGRRNCDSTFC